MVASMVAASYLEDDAVKLPTASCLLLQLTTYLEDDAVHVGRAKAAPMLL
jgi:hypothetical protein